MSSAGHPLLWRATDRITDELAVRHALLPWLHPVWARFRNAQEADPDLRTGRHSFRVGLWPEKVLQDVVGDGLRQVAVDPEHLADMFVLQLGTNIALQAVCRRSYLDMALKLEAGTRAGNGVVIAQGEADKRHAAGAGTSCIASLGAMGAPILCISATTSGAAVGRYFIEPGNVFAHASDLPPGTQIASLRAAAVEAYRADGLRATQRDGARFTTKTRRRALRLSDVGDMEGAGRVFGEAVEATEALRSESPRWNC